MAETIIKAENLCFAYDDDELGAIVIENMNLEIEKGSFVAILGYNGSGKSTLAKLINLILTPTSGSLYYFGEKCDFDKMTEDEFFELRRRIGMVFQNPDNQLVATMVEEDVAFGCENLGIAPAKIRERVDRALETVGMTKYARHATHRLSGGQKQRIAIAGVIAMRRKCIIFDESTSMLDPSGRREVMDTIRRLNREEGITVIHITHYMSEATLADRVLVMSEGRVAMDGTPREVFSRAPKMWEMGLDVPQTTELLFRMMEAGYDVRCDIFEPDECAAEIKRALMEGKKI